LLLILLNLLPLPVSEDFWIARNWSAAIAFPCEPLPRVLQIYLIFGFGFAIIKCCEFVVLEKEEEEEDE
jgi:hypothetical protein